MSVTAGCFLYYAWEAMIIGMIGSLLACITMPLFDRMSVDDPVGASSVHGVCGIWGTNFLSQNRFILIKRLFINFRSDCCWFICR